MNLPEACQKLCSTGKCKNDCCGPAPVLAWEIDLINKYIEKNKLDLPKVEKNKLLGIALTPTDFSLKCRYIKKRKCAIYEVRPAICRIFGTLNRPHCQCPKLAEYAK